MQWVIQTKAVFRAAVALLAIATCAAIAVPGAGAITIGSIGQTARPVEVERNITYRTSNTGVVLRLDVWRLQDRSAKRPVVVLVHGGGWRSGDKLEWEQAAWPATFARRGYVVFSVNYRLACEGVVEEKFKPESAELCGHSMAEARYDVREALRWVRRNAHAHDGDPNRISMVGGSAGAQLAMLVASDVDAPPVRSVLALSPPAHLPWFGNRFPVPRLQDALNNVFGCTFANCRGAWRAYSPSMHVRRGRTPPTYLFASGADQLTPYAQVLIYWRVLVREGVPTLFRTTRYATERCHGTRFCLYAPLKGTALRQRADALAFLAAND